MIDPLLTFTSFVAGLLTILAPCVLPLLPVIVGGAAGSRNKWYPLILVLSLSGSVIAFTLLLKASTLLIDIPQVFWTSISGGILLLFGLIWLFPNMWEHITVKLNLLGSSQRGLTAAGHVESNWGAVLMGAALGPVFSSCSPTYFVILATVLPVSFASGLFYLLVYGIGLALMLGLIAFFGQKLTMKLGWAANPHGLFKKIMGILLVLVGLSIITGIEKKIESAILDAGFGVTEYETKLLDDMDMPRETINAPEGAENNSNLPYLFEAPELTGLTNWINSDGYNSMEDLRGKVVLVDFWTYSCINCIRTLPYIQSWHEKYADDGLVILGIHAPEFQFEQKFENVQKAAKEFGLTYPIVQDNDFKTWRAYRNRYWPAKYLIDQDGIVRYTHFGEGDYEETESYITELLNTDMKMTEVAAPSVDFDQIGTRETYVGLGRRANFVSDTEAELKSGEWTLSGNWDPDDEKVISVSENAGIRMNFTASKANLVIGGEGMAQVLIDGEPANSSNEGADVVNGVLILDGERLYELTDFNGDYDSHEIEIIFDTPGTELFAWTFG
jgi:cytochrome c biogenesis protein CcdA/thiol-disulfide isomerase/thioredoxin